MLEEERRDVELLGRELLEDVLSIVGAVVASNPGVATPDDEVGAAVVLAAHPDLGQASARYQAYLLCPCYCNVERIS
jgi:hypothetical protein